MSSQLAVGAAAAPSRSRAFRLAACLALTLVLAATAPAPWGGAGTAGAPGGHTLSVVVSAEPGAAGAVAARLLHMGATAVRALPGVDMVTARIAPGLVGRAADLPGVRALSPDAPVRLRHAVDGHDPSADPHSLHSLVQAIGAREYYDRGYTGVGVDIALIDSGVAAVAGLDQPGKVVRGPDLSFESQDAARRHVDTFGHGTHMAGIIAGRDAGLSAPGGSDHHAFHGVAPGARLVSVKVADAHGATDVSQVIAAIDWVVQHRRDAGLNIRVLNLSFGTDGAQDYRLDPLAHAAEVAWRKGIVVVAAAGNQGFGTASLNNPARDPFLLAVGAQDTRGTQAHSDDAIPPFSSLGDGVRDPDLVAPGVSVASLRVPGSTIDEQHPTGRAGTRYFRGSGTSQAAAMVSGAAALVLQQHPDLTPDEVKHLLRATAQALPSADPRGQGRGTLNLGTAVRATPARGVRQTWQPSAGSGSLDAARGSLRLTRDDEVLDGERDVFGAPFDAGAHAAVAEGEAAWTGGDWNGGAWAGAGWSQGAWSPVEWLRSSWSRSSWSGGLWSRSSWSRSSWSGEAWGAGGWS